MSTHGLRYWQNWLPGIVNTGRFSVEKFAKMKLQAYWFLQKDTRGVGLPQEAKWSQYEKNEGQKSCKQTIFNKKNRIVYKLLFGTLRR